ncbi:MAG: hypothetical protein ACI4S3_04360, partial [Candidatus Gastranaerophilaceae bacterium]
MAKVSLEVAEQMAPSQGEGVGFFNLKNDGESAIVRILHDSVSDFDLLTVHDVQYNGKYRKLNCIRSPHDPITACPACRANLKVGTRFFIHLIQYEMDGTGAIIAKPKIWERSLAYANQLKDLINTYGPLSNSVFKITRNGKPKDMNTTYSILYCPAEMYPVEKYPLQPELFDNYNVLGSVVLDKSAQEIETFLSTGTFPETSKPTEAGVTSQPVYEAPMQQQFNPAPPTGVQPPFDPPYQTVNTAPASFGQGQQIQRLSPGISQPRRIGTAHFNGTHLHRTENIGHLTHL